MTTDETDGDADAAAEAHRRRTIVRLLVGVGIGVPVLIELATLVGLVEQSLLGGDGDDGTAGTEGTTTGTGTAVGDGVGVGEELLPGTPQRETLSVASYRAGDERWILTLAATVENTGTEPYTVVFGAVTTGGGRSVAGQNRAVTVPAGETRQVTGTWQLPRGSRPATVVVRTGTGESATTDHRVDLGRIPVEGN
jgi:hypothetical protein